MQNQTLSHALATNTQTKTPSVANGTIIYPGANVWNLGVILDSSLGPEFHLSTSPTVGMENSERCPVALRLIVLAATVLVQATILSHLVVAAAASLHHSPAVCPLCHSQGYLLPMGPGLLLRL